MVLEVLDFLKFILASIDTISAHENKDSYREIKIQQSKNLQKNLSQQNLFFNR
jgi:hypothetical protein